MNYIFLTFLILPVRIRVPQPWHYWLFGLDNSWLWMAILCIVKSLVESFVSGLYLPDASSTDSLKSPCSSPRIVTTKNVSRHRQMSPRRQVYSQLRTIVLDNELHKNKCCINLPHSCSAVLLTLTASTTKTLLEFLLAIYHNHLESFKEIQGPRV